MKNRYIIKNILNISQFSFLLKIFKVGSIWTNLQYPRYIRISDNLLLGQGSMDFLKYENIIFDINKYEEIDFKDFLKLKNITTIDYLKKYNGKI